MPTIRYQIRNEYGLADPELYRAADKDDPEALLEGVAMAGLVGVLRQLGDLAEFAAEIFHDLHEEVTATAARGHGLMLRVKQLEAEFPSIEKAFLSQTCHSRFAYNEGFDWHANLRMDQNLVTQGEMPRFILDSYEECRGPPRLFMLDKFDVAGAGACLKRYSDPSFFKVDLASSGMMEEEVQREKKSRKIKKKGSRWRNGETTESFLAPLINSNLQPATSDKVSEKVPTRRVKLKSRNSINPDTTNRRSYMERLLEVHSPEQKLLSVNSISYAPIMINSIDSSETAPEVREIVIDTPADSTIVRERNPTQSPTKQEVAYLPTNELENQKAKDVKMLEIIPEQNILTESRTKTEFTVDGYRSDETEKSPPALLEVNQKNSLADADITTGGGLDGYRSDDMNKTEVGVDGYRPIEAENSPPALPEVNKKKSLADDKCTTEGGFDDYRSDDIGSDLDNYMDALNSMESEIETDSESRAKSDPHFLSMRSQGIDSGINERQQELPAQFLEPDSFENFTASRGVNNMLKNGLSSLSESNSSGDLADTWPSQEKMSSFDVPANQEICLDETHDKTPEELQRNGEVREFISSFHLLPSETYNAKESDVTSIKSETGEASSGCVADSILSPINVCLQGSEAQSVTVDSKETFSGYVEGTREVAPQLDSNVEELPKYADYPEIFSDELLHLSDIGGLPLVGEDVLQENHPIEYADEAQSVTVHPNETFAGYVEGTHDVAQQLDGNMEEVSKFAGYSNIFLDELLLLSDLEGSSPARKDVPEETHPAECVEEQISANIADRLGMLDRLFQTQDESNLDEAPTQYAEGSLLTVEEALHLEGEQQPLIEQDTEVCSGESILPTIPAISPNINSTIVQPDDLAGDMENVEQPEDLAAEISSNDVKGTQEVVRDLDGKLQCAVETSQAFDGMAFPEPAENFIISSDDLFLVYDISEKTNTAEDAEELFSEDMANTQGESIPEEVPTGCVKDLPASFTEQDTEACIGESTSATNCDISLEISPIIMHSDGLAAEIENRVAPGEDSSADDIGQSKILMPKIVPLELEHFSNAEEPQESHEVGSSELLPLSSGNEAFADDMQVQSNEPVCAVIDAPDPVADNLEFPCGSIVSNLHKDALQIENLTGCDDSLSEYVIVEADDDNQGPCSIYSLDASGFDVQLQEDYLPGDAIRNQHNVEINVTSSPKNITVLPQNEERPVSFPAVSSSKLPILDSSHSSDAKLLDGVCYPILSEPSIDEENLIYSSENEDSSSKEGLSPSTHFLVEPAILLQASNEPNVISSYQEVEHLEAPDIQFERACSDEQHITQSNSKDIDDQPSEPEPYAIISNGVINELDIPLSNTGIHEQLKAEASVPSECTSEISVGSLASHVSDAGLALIANSSTAISETSPQESSEPWPGEPTSHFQLQVVEETPPLPPLPPMEWRMGKLRLGSLTPGGDIAQPPTVASPFMELSTMDEKHPQGSVTTGVEMVQPANPFAALPVLEYERFQHGILTSEGEIVRPSRLSELPTIVDEETHQHGTLFLEGEVVNPSNPFLVVSHTEDEKYSSGHDAPVPALEDETTQYPQLLQGGVRSIQDKRPQLGQLLPSLELERSRHETLSIEKDPMLPLNPFLVISSAEEWKHQYGYGVYGGESLHYLNLSAPLPLTGPNMPPYGFLYSMGENPSTIYDFMVPAMEGEKPSWKHRSIRDRPRDPLIEAVAAHDKSTMRKVSEFHHPSARPKEDERDSLLEQIRSKSFNLKPANPSKPNVEGPPTNLKVAAIVEKANKIRQAFVGSDEDDDDGESWSDS